MSLNRCVPSSLAVVTRERVWDRLISHYYEYVKTADGDGDTSDGDGGHAYMAISAMR